MTTRTTTLSLPATGEVATWTERESRLALTVWAEPNNPALGAWLTRRAQTGAGTHRLIRENGATLVTDATDALALL